MTLYILSYLAGVLTIATPCIFPILPFVLARADQPFRRGALPMLLGLAFAFAVVVSLASFAGGWAVEANRYGRIVALALLLLFGLTMLLPALATRMTAPIVSAGSRLANWAGRRTADGDVTPIASALLGVATGFVWAPCAGPVLGLILTAAALKGPGAETSLLLLVYGLGAATSLAAGVFFGGRLLALAKGSLRWGDGLRRVIGLAVVAGALTISLGLDTSLLTRWSSARTTLVERNLIAALRSAPEFGLSSPAYAATATSPLASLAGARQWLNTPPLRAEDLRGKVVLVNFWTYSCINCLRILPHVRAWADKYKDRGLVVIGVHTPEFAFEKDPGNVRTALGSLGIGYPVAIDNDYRIWRAFDNQAWPGLYFIGADGRVRHRLLGEGNYEQSEQLIQQLLSEAKGTRVTGDLVAINGKGAQADADRQQLGSPETYIGYAQADSFAAPDEVSKDVPSVYRTVSALPLNRWSLGGRWTIESEFGVLAGTRGSIRHRFHARDLHLVLAPPAGGHPIRFRVTIDGAAPGADHGSDVDAEGWGTVRDARLYQLVRQAGPVRDRTFEIEFLDTGVRAYAFTFG